MLSIRFNPVSVNTRLSPVKHSIWLESVAIRTWSLGAVIERRSDLSPLRLGRFWHWLTTQILLLCLTNIRSLSTFGQYTIPSNSRVVMCRLVSIDPYLLVRSYNLQQYGASLPDVRFL